MKLEINIEKKAVLFLAVLVIGVAIIGLVVAYTSGWSGQAGDPTNPPIMGHSADEINVYHNGLLKTLQQAIDDGAFGGISLSNCVWEPASPKNNYADNQYHTALCSSGKVATGVQIYATDRFDGYMQVYCCDIVIS